MSERKQFEIVDYGTVANIIDRHGQIVWEDVPSKLAAQFVRQVEALEAARLIFKDTLEWNAIVHIDKPTVSIGNIIDAALADVKEPQP